MICKDCGKEFELEAGEIEFFEKRKLPMPKRCKHCRKTKKQRYSNNNGSEEVATAIKVNTNKVVTLKDPVKIGKVEKKIPSSDVKGTVIGGKVDFGKGQPTPLDPPVKPKEDKE